LPEAGIPATLGNTIAQDNNIIKIIKKNKSSMPFGLI
jgi:hypothetical protein